MILFGYNNIKHWNIKEKRFLYPLKSETFNKLKICVGVGWEVETALLVPTVKIALSRLCL